MMNLFVISVLLLLQGFPCTVSHVVENFRECQMFFKKNQPPEIPGILKKDSQDKDRYKLICQRFENDYRYATLYDTKNKIPVFSAYNFTGKGDFKREDVLPNNWMIESQLEAQSDAMTEPYVKQASNDNYRDNTQGLTRGHLFPSAHAPDADTARSTFTLTNTVPMTESFNRDIWTKVENELANLIALHCLDNEKRFSGHVLTGTLPGQTKLMERVNIPSVIWTAFCCEKGERAYSRAYWTYNSHTNTKETIAFKKLKEFEDFLDDALKKSRSKIFSKLFHKDCKRDQMIHEDEM